MYGQSQSLGSSCWFVVLNVGEVVFDFFFSHVVSQLVLIFWLHVHDLYEEEEEKKKDATIYQTLVKSVVPSICTFRKGNCTRS